MTGRRDRDDPEFDALWRGFASSEVQMQAPGCVGPAVMAAWDAAQSQPARPRFRRWLRVPALVALGGAALLLALGLAVRHGSGRGIADESSAAGGSRPVASEPSDEVAATRSSAGEPASTTDVGPRAVQESPHARVPPARRSVVRDRAPGPGADPPRIAADPIVTLAVSQTFETEAFQIMRVRVPRVALQAFGVPFLEPEAAGLVDVDVLVGDDGLARDIRRIRPVVNAGAGGSP